MKTNSLLTYVLYALLLGLILVAGYKACEIRQEQTNRQKENAELDQVMRDLGYNGDTTASGSSYLGADSMAKTTPPPSSQKQQPKVSATGIENDGPAPQTQSKKVESPTTAAKPTTTTSTTPKSPGLSGKPPVSSGRYYVVTGSFDYVENARDAMETLVKAGYRNAEVKKFTAARAHVVALRTNDRAAADRAVAKLRTEGYPDAYVKTQ